jgi:hypothetical protein
LVVLRDELSVRERAVLFALLGEARQVSNLELETLIGFRLIGQERRRLNDRKLVESAKVGHGVYAHELSDAGWRWCAEDLTQGPAGRGSSLERAHYLLFGRFVRYLNAAGLSLAEFVTAVPQGGHDAVAHSAGRPRGRHAVNVTARVEAAYRELAPASGEFVRLRDLRERVADIPRPDVDSALVVLFTSQRINLIPQENQQALSAADRASALRIGGENKHLISIE